MHKLLLNSEAQAEQPLAEIKRKEAKALCLKTKVTNEDIFKSHLLQPLPIFYPTICRGLNKKQANRKHHRDTERRGKELESTRTPELIVAPH